MVDRYEVFGVASAACVILSAVLYVLSMLAGKTKPSRASYWIWFSMSSLIFFSFLKSGGTTVWLQLAYVVNPMVIAVLSLRYGEGIGLSRLEKGVIAIAAFSIPLWVGLRAKWGDTPEVALPILLLNLFADALGGLPTYLKVWQRPETEDRLAWIVCAVGCVLNLFAVRAWNVPDIVWNGFMTTAAIYVALACFRRPSVLTTQAG